MARDLHELTMQEILPGSIAQDAAVQGIAAASDPELQAATRDIREALILARIDELPEAVVDILAWQFHVDLYEPGLPLDVKRALVKGSIPWHRKKGTKWAVLRALEGFGLEATIAEWFEPGVGGRPHTFSVTGFYRDDPDNVFFLGPDTEGILMRAVEVAKPVRSWLLHLSVSPPPTDFTTHLCIWDWDTWDHGRAQEYEFGSLSPVLGVGELDPLLELAATIWRATGAVCDRGAVWDCVRWEDALPSARAELIASGLGRAFFASLDWGAVGPPPPGWSERHDWDHGWTWDETTEETASATGFLYKEVE